MSILVFDLKAPLAHFRRPDATATHATYPFITATALRGLLGAVLGHEDFIHEDALAGVRLMSHVKTRVQQLSLLGKGFLRSGSPFNRQTAVELLINPHYRVYYTGPYMQELSDRIEAGQSVYHTYLGSAFALVVPKWIGVFHGTQIELQAGDKVQCATVVPMPLVDRLYFGENDQLARAGGMLQQYLGGRRFRGTINLVYEVNGRPINFSMTKEGSEIRSNFVEIEGEGIACLW